MRGGGCGCEIARGAEGAAVTCGRATWLVGGCAPQLCRPCPTPALYRAHISRSRSRSRYCAWILALTPPPHTHSLDPDPDSGTVSVCVNPDAQHPAPTQRGGMHRPATSHVLPLPPLGAPTLSAIISLQASQQVCCVLRRRRSSLAFSTWCSRRRLRDQRSHLIQTATQQSCCTEHAGAPMHGIQMHTCAC